MPETPRRGLTNSGTPFARNDRCVLPRTAGSVGLPAAGVLFTLDGFRDAAAAKEGEGSYFDLMRRAFVAKAQALGYEVIDLDRLFMALERAGQRYDYPDDAHWSGNGHAVAAVAVMSSRMLAGCSISARAKVDLSGAGTTSGQWCLLNADNEMGEDTWRRSNCGVDTGRLRLSTTSRRRSSTAA